MSERKREDANMKKGKKFEDIMEVVAFHGCFSGCSGLFGSIYDVTNIKNLIDEYVETLKKGGKNG